MKLRRFLGVVLLLVTVLVLYAVGVSAEGVLVLSAKDLQNYNPVELLGRNDDIHVATQIWDSLVIVGKDAFSPQPELATSWESIDGLTWVLHLREGVTYQDGNDLFAEGEAREVTAEDVVYSINLHKQYASFLNLQNIVEAITLDRYTVQVKTDTPQPLLLSGIHRLNSVLIIPPEAVEETETGVTILPVGSGPFELQTFIPGEKAIMTKNEDYWLPTILDELQLIVIPDAAASVIALEAGQIDVLMYGPADEGPRLVDEGFQLARRGGSFRGLGFNVTAAPVDDIRVRKALSMALDVDSAWQAVIPEGFGERAYGQVPPWVPMGYDPEGLKGLDKFDQEGALNLLAAAGWTDTDGDGFLDKDGKKLSFDMKCFSGAQVRVLTIIATQLQELGIDAKVLQQDVGVWVDDLLAGNSTVFFDFSYAGDTGLYSMFYSGAIGASNPHHYANSAVDVLLDEALMTIDFDKRSTLWKAAQRIIVEDQAIIPLYFEWTTTYVAPYVKDWVSPWGGLALVSVENNVYLEK